MKVESIQCPVMGTRKKYTLDENDNALVDFKPGIEVLPAMYHGVSNPGSYYYVQIHQPGEPFWKEGGHECLDENGYKRAFHLDSLIVHPKLFKKKAKMKETTDKPKGKRGRPKMDPSLRKTPTVYVPTGGKRGRPKKNI